MLEDHLSNWNLAEESDLLNSFISLDTLKHQFDPRYGMYIHAIASVRIDASNNSTGIVVEDVRLYGDPFESDMFKAYFVSQYEAYVYALVDKYPIKKDYGVDECEFLIHRQKFRICG